MRPDRRTLPAVGLAVVVVLAGVVVGAFFGLLSGFIYSPWGDVNGDLLVLLCLSAGAASGAGAAILWLVAMRLISRAGGGLRIVLAGVGLGAAAGAIATVLLHIVLILATQKWEMMSMLLFGQVLGVPAGLAAGLVCGFAAWGAKAWEHRLSRQAAATPAADTAGQRDRAASDGPGPGPQEGHA